MTDRVSALQFSLTWVQPELLLAAFALLATLIGARFKDKATPVLSGLCMAVLVAAGTLAFLWRPEQPIPVFGGSLVIDGYGGLAKAIIAYAAAATLYIGADAFARDGDRRFEFPILVSLSALGFFVMVSANDLIALYIGIELQSLAAYTLAAFRRDDARSSEAGLKYFVLGALSSGLLLYGASLIYGFTGSIQFGPIAEAAMAGGVGVIFGLVFLICGVAFKMSAAPFHMWTPDVYEGAPTPVTALFAAAPKVAAVALLVRVLYGPFIDLADQWRQVIVALAAISLLVGSFGALLQNNIKRLMAYSSIANIGFVLMALAAGTQAGASAALLYMAFYLPATIGAFAVILAMRRGGEPTEKIDDLAGLARRRPWLAYALTGVMFSLTGIPPLVGFFGKYYAFVATIDAGLWPLALVGAVATVVSAGYYLRIVKVIWVDEPAPAFDKPGPAVAVAATGGFLLTLGLTPAIGVVEAWVRAAAFTSFLAP